MKQHPDYEVTALLRTLPETFNQQYPHVRIVRGDYDSAEILADEAEKADVVVREFASPTYCFEIVRGGVTKVVM